GQDDRLRRAQPNSNEQMIVIRISSFPSSERRCFATLPPVGVGAFALVIVVFFKQSATVVLQSVISAHDAGQRGGEERVHGSQHRHVYFHERRFVVAE